jgi:hypothetical protein
MIAYAPFLGQARLGQGFVTTLTWEQTQQWNREFKEGLAKHPECANQTTQYVMEYVAGVEAGRLPSEGLPMMQKDLDEYRTFKECVAKSGAPGTAPTSPGAAPSHGGLPTWAWVVGGLAAVGILGLVFSRK